MRRFERVVIHEHRILPVHEVGQIFDVDLTHEIRNPNAHVHGHAEKYDCGNRKIQPETVGVAPAFRFAFAQIALQPNRRDHDERDAVRHDAVPLARNQCAKQHGECDKPSG